MNNTQRQSRAMKVWVTADTHFGDEKIIDFCKRPFKNVDEMNEVLIRQWNGLVGPEDMVWHLGDFGFGDKIQIQAWVAALNGEKRLIRGNHDTNSNQWYRDCGFLEVYDYPVVIKDFIILSHKPMDIINQHSVFGNIYGHVHDDERYIQTTAHTACVSTERWNFSPILLDELLPKRTGGICER